MNRLRSSRELAAVWTVTRWRASASRWMYSSSSDMSADTSGLGRCQFSFENANNDSAPTPTSIAPSTTSRPDCMPARCPNVRGMTRSRAQRPLPSMMTATCRGIRPCSRMRPSSSSLVRSGTAPSLSSDFHDLGFLRLDQLVNVVDVVVMKLLDILLGVLHLVLRHTRQLLEPLPGVAAGVAHGDAAVLGELVHDLHQLTPALLVHLGQRHADDGALVRRLEPHARIADRLLDHLGLAL